ncbi:MAG: PepSY domain-containing protein [Methyloglobulus sp.]|nr:PepSY domain-containing protein [Methyloglobulus sp.]
MTRHFWVLVHRYVGLTIAFFLIVAGLTGSILAFYDEIDDWLNPHSSRSHTRVAIPAGQPLLEPFDLCERALKQVPQARINLMFLRPQPGEAYEVFLEPRIDPATGQPYPLTFSGIKLNPYTGVEIERIPVAPAQEIYFPLTRKNILRFVYALHYQLAIGETGGLVFGIVALVWTVDSLVGFYLTLPKRRRKPYSTNVNVSARHSGNPCRNDDFLKQTAFKQNSFFQRWKPAWLVKWSASVLRINFDLHRAGGLWVWPMLIVFAWSSVMLNLPQIYNPVMVYFFEYPSEKEPFSDLPKPQPDPPIDFRGAYAIGQRLMAEQARLKGFTVSYKQPYSMMSYDGAKGVFNYFVSSNLDISSKRPETALTFDANTGKFIGIWPLPSGEYSGVTVGSWFLALHFAWIWGLPYKIFVCFMGLVVAMLSVTGVYIWWKKRRAAQTKLNKSTSAKIIYGRNN